jgi:hypothetical protein
MAHLYGYPTQLGFIGVSVANRRWRVAENTHFTFLTSLLSIEFEDFINATEF